MSNRIQKGIIAGILGTSVMTLVMYIGYIIGMPKMNPAEMLAGMLGVSNTIGWLLHFMTGIIFALTYSLVFFKVIYRIKNMWVKGIVFGLAVFVFAQIALAVMPSIMGPMPEPEGNMMLIAIGSIISHLIYGITVVKFIKE